MPPEDAVHVRCDLDDYLTLFERVTRLEEKVGAEKESNE